MWLIDNSKCGIFQGQCNKLRKPQMQIGHKKNLDWQEKSSWLFTCTSVLHAELNLGLQYITTEKQLHIVVRAELEPGTFSTTTTQPN